MNMQQSAVHLIALTKGFSLSAFKRKCAREDSLLVGALVTSLFRFSSASVSLTRGRTLMYILMDIKCFLFQCANCLACWCFFLTELLHIIR